MASACHRCALRLQRAAAALETRHATPRSFSTTISRSRQAIQLPTFIESSNAELNEIFATLRRYHFIPAYLDQRRRRLICAPKNWSMLKANPLVTTIGDEDVQLEPLDSLTLPNRRRLLVRALRILEKGDEQDWANVPALLAGMSGGVQKLPPGDAWIGKLVRKALIAGQMGMVMQCVRQPERTGLSLTKAELLDILLLELHRMAQRDEWSRTATEEALKHAGAISTLLETPGSGSFVASTKQRAPSKVFGVLVELAATFALRYQDGTDPDGVVKAYTGRLLSRLEETSKNVQITVPEKERQWDMLFSIRILRALRLAQEVLGPDMPKADLAKELTAKYEAALTLAAEQLQSRNPDPGSYDAEALTEWKQSAQD